MLFIQQTLKLLWLHPGLCFQCKLFHLCNFKFTYSDTQLQSLSFLHFSICLFQPYQLLLYVWTTSFFLSLFFQSISLFGFTSPQLRAHSPQTEFFTPHPIPHAACTFPKQVQSNHLLVLQEKINYVDRTSNKIVVSSFSTTKNILVREASSQLPFAFIQFFTTFSITPLLSFLPSLAASDVSHLFLYSKNRGH